MCGRTHFAIQATARDYERLDTTLKGLHLLAFATLMLRNLAQTLSPSS